MATQLQYRAFKDKAIKYLGGVCVQCGTTENLEFDHILPEDKEFTITNNWGYAWEDVKQELDKCQLLCAAHHTDKHRNNAYHGTLTGYTGYKCRCDLCRANWNVKNNEYKKKYRTKLKLNGSVA